MKSTTKKISVFAVVAAIAALVLGVSVTLLSGVRYDVATADTENNIGRTYYYDELGNSELAQKFYSVMSDMAKNGSFKNGNSEYDLSDVLTQTEIADYVDLGSPKIPVAFSAARDSFYMDNPDLFYLDVYKLYFTAGMQGGKYVAFIDSGRADNYFVDGTISSETEVNSAITLYENEIKKIVNDAKAAGDVIKQIEYVNNYICENVEYDYDKRDNEDYTGYVSTSYGALVEKKAMCGGYSRAFKAVMDRLGIPCVLIQGYVYKESNVQGLEGGYSAHMWNAVQLDGLWYGVDTTYNSGAADKSKYLLVGEEFISQNHFEDGVISSSGFELDYPALRPFNYGVDEDKNGFTFKDSGSLTADGKTTDFGYLTSTPTDPVTGKPGRETTTLTLGVSYDGMDAETLEKEGKYLAYREIGVDGKASSWLGIAAWERGNGGYGYIDGYTVAIYYEATNKVQYAIIDRAPDVDIFGEANTGDMNVAYDPAKLTAENIIAMSAVYSNDAYGTYIPAPYAKSVTPSNTGYIQSFDPVDITIEYNKKLVYVEGKNKADVGVTVIGSPHEDVSKYIKIENINWDENTNTLFFRFTPSKQFIHNCEIYSFTPTNLVADDSGKAPEEVRYSFKRKQVVCPKVFNDGRLYMQVFGYPQFVGAEDMSLTGFKDEFGQPVAGNQRSQLMLVVNEPGKQESAEMMDALLDDDAIGLDKSDIKSSSTYQIDLQMCGLVQKVPDGSYMQVGFGFPEGYGPEDKGVTFTVYHYTRNPDGTVKSVEQMPCVVTEYGIIATVKSFSPFMICAVDASKVTQKSIYASVSGVGGSIDKTVVQSVADGENVTYTLKANDGYQLDKVLLNGKNIADSVTEGGVLTLAYADLTGNKIGENDNANNNILEVTFISTRAAKSYADRGITVVSPKIVVTEDELLRAKPHEPSVIPQGGKNYTGLIVGIVVAIIVLACAGVAVYFIFRNKKKTEKKAAAASNKNSSAKPAASSSAQRPTAPKSTVAATQAKPTAPRSAATAATPTKPTANNGAASARTNTPSARPSASARPSSSAAPKTTNAARPASSTRPTSSTSAAKRPISRNDTDKNKK